MIYHSYNEFIGALILHVRKYGRDKLRAVDCNKTFQTGFESPGGKLMITLAAIKKEFSKGQQLRENTSVMDYYHNHGGKAPAVVMTRVPPANVVGNMHKEMLIKAIEAGEQLRAKDLLH